jgi:hypothetical protein
MQRRKALGLAVLSIALLSIALVQIVLVRAAADSDARDARPTEVSLAAEPEARLQFPGSTEYAAGGHDAYWTMESGSTPAIVKRYQGVDATWDEIVTHFRG